jgi:uncharacterized protein YajQ (UPF0234 family)
MASSFSFDIVSDYDAGEMNNVFDQARREISNRYDFKGTSASLDWLDGDKTGFKVTGDNSYHIDAVMDMVRKKAAVRGISQKTFDVTREQIESNLKVTQDIPFLKGLDQDKAKKITKLLRDKFPKVKAQIQGEEVRITSPKKDELQAVMNLLNEAKFDFPISFTNFR